MRNALSVDLEDWYHVCGQSRYSDPDGWGEYESRVTRNTEKILEMLCLGQGPHRATFFVLGYIAEKNPALIRRIAGQGHELAVHGYYHRRVFEMTPVEFENDLRASIGVVEDITGEKVLGFRAPEWSIRGEAKWAFPIIAKAGLKYDSSTVPLTMMGERVYARLPYSMETPYGPLVEFPLTTFRCLWENLPFTGGLPLRIAPYWYVCEQIRRLNARGVPAISYIHPWEFDESHPEIDLPFSRRFMHYFNIRSTRRKMEGLLRNFRFAPVKDVLGL
ncbi:MAG: polysaccharide deacetylase family protein [Deltaproteobacteria bacterium]